MEQVELRQVDLARLAGVTKNTARHAFRGRLVPARTPDGCRVFESHPLVQEYIHRQSPARRRALRAAAEREAARNGKPPPFTNLDAQLSAKLAALVVLTESAKDAEERTKQGLRQISVAGEGDLPSDLDELGRLTLREIMERYGSTRGFSDLVKAAKVFAEFKLKEVDAEKKRGQLVDRKAFAAVLGITETAFRRLTGEAPAALRERIIARVLSGGESLALDVEELIHDQISGILGDCVSTLNAEIEKLR